MSAKRPWTRKRLYNELCVWLGYAGIAVVWWGSNWKVALGVFLAMGAHSALTIDRPKDL